MTLPDPGLIPGKPNPDSAFVRRFFYALVAIALVLNILPVAARLLQGPPSPEALRYFPIDQVQRARELARANIIPGTLAGLAPVGALLWLCFTQSGARLVRWLEGPPGRRRWLSALLVTTGAIVLSSVAEFPFRLILFQIATSHGLTVQPLGSWLAQWGMSLVVDLLQVSLAAVPAYYLIRRWPRTWWLGGAAMGAAVVLFVSLFYPIFIAPLFDPVRPIANPQVLETVNRLADQAGVQVGEVRMVIASARTTAVNLQVQGFGPTRRVVIWDTALQQLTPDELEVALAHELGHTAIHYIALLSLSRAAVLALEVSLIALILRRMATVGAAGLREPYPPRVIGVALLLVALLGTVTEPALNTLTRSLESRADRFALHLTGKPEAFITAIARVHATHLADPEPPAIGEFLRLDHPSPMARIRMGLEFRKP